VDVRVLGRMPRLFRAGLLDRFTHVSCVIVENPD
jgi:hypothetical protein